MCKTYNMIGSLTTIKSHLNGNNIHDFKSLKEVIDFQQSYVDQRQQIVTYHENLIEQEKNLLCSDLQQLDKEIETQRLQSANYLSDEIETLKQQLINLSGYSSANLFQGLSKLLSQWNCKRKIKFIEDNFDSEVQRSIGNLVDIRQAKSIRHQFLISQFRDAVKLSARHPLSEIDRKKTIIDELNSFIYGAIGEQKVVRTLENLSDEYFLINDFSVSFSSAIYNRLEREYIRSVQIDHILIAPSGIFLIETKNWSEQSLENLSLRSPVEQIMRTSFALFKLLNNELKDNHLYLDMHHWGNRKISIRNLIVLINKKPKEEFQHVKILTLNELLGYINYFKPIFSSIETQRIADFLININDQKVI